MTIVHRCILALLALMLNLPAVAGAPLELVPGTRNVALSPHLSYRHDQESSDRPEDAWRRAADGAFEPLPGGKDTFGFQRGAFWFHATIVNRDPSEPRWLLVQEYPLSDRLELYLRYPDGRVVEHVGGDHVPFSARSVRYRHPNFLVDLPVDVPVQLLLRVKSESSMQVPLQLYTQAAFTEVSRDAQLAIGLYYGILLALFFYNLVLWISLRDSSYFWYLCHITAFGLVLFTLNGLGFEYLWPRSPWLADHMVPISICLALVAMLQFARIFLELPERAPRLNVGTALLIGFFVVFGVASIWLPYRVSTPVASRAVLVGVLWIVFATLHVLRRGYTPARLLLLAWSMFLLGTAIFTLLAFGVLPKNFATEYGVQIGSALEMLLLSIALGYRYAQLRNENQRITDEANRQLERNVAERTRELQRALSQLEETHERLRDSSRRDALTGLYNRSYFHEGFERLLAQCRDARRPLSLLMVDLDHFKSINDRHGHLVGDDCLRWAAHRIGRALRPHDALLARFGGEEFVVVLPDHDLRAAVEVAEEVRRSLVAEACESQGVQLRVSASIGVHTIAPDAADDIDDALDTADKALYAAKANGRDCVRTSITAA
ncbi:diguanylate cyclase (GGDEF)-like protein [Luteimonas sp. J16]|jgi:diguanylate cyclase (GGDEF)-like protein|uniref:sensor domain-containing diguanylate cyclase n=1 Tax=unclassified Luteimonas TaxID=2629088 RepID=UPI0004B1599D|nr:MULTISPECIES: diguanylate cyclase [unclassified Luteimonas]TWG89864.1 diguanylate cyclase (GGDEF)-like protein [Luteimonas sp. J16]TWG91467.1 diguanylate cyclase (GGDEF)-like protein [Luteimonas sp. J16]